MTRFLRNLGLIGAALLLSACGLFSDTDESLEPVELVNFDQSVKIKRLWSANLGAKTEFLRLSLRPVGDGIRVYAASHDGTVFAFDPETGKRQWRTDLDLSISAGPGAANGLVVVTSSDGQVIALDAKDGTERWRGEAGGESLARPVIGEDVVFIQTVDNRLLAFEAFDGSERWTLLQSMPDLTMRGSATPLVVGTSVVAGFDNGRLVAVNIDTGDIVWDSLLAPASGRSDLERLSDIDGAMAVVGQDIYAAGYQGRLGAVAAESGQIMWAVEISTYAGVSADWTSLYTAQDTGVLTAMSRRNGTESWRQDALLRREPTVPVPFNTTVVSGDLEGYLHFFSNVDGEPVARVRFGSAAISGAPIVVGNRLFVQNDSGQIAAYVVVEPKRPPAAPDISDDGA